MDTDPGKIFLQISGSHSPVMHSDRRPYHERGEIVAWLSDVPFRLHIAGDRHPDTCAWLLVNEIFGGWESSESSSLLWLSGPGHTGVLGCSSWERGLIYNARKSGGSGKMTLAYVSVVVFP